ncbi:hypothetical protein Pint_36553 [Pistacia integerrima]|uniref:Uncharacterized protein n=1 Tax=Pistacia integerrima TaxID=434235 RepID=A0ACC0Y116_9ROSI|nr:hypothetical protein Pint_36553 [Pistacia integerrima]
MGVEGTLSADIRVLSDLQTLADRTSSNIHWEFEETNHLNSGSSQFFWTNSCIYWISTAVGLPIMKYITPSLRYKNAHLIVYSISIFTHWQVPSSLGLVQTLEVLLLSNNNLTGPMPNLTGMNLTYLDMSNNSFNAPGIPLWLAGNPICRTWGEGEDCTVFQLSSNCSTPPKNCTPVSCGSDKISSPTCQ